MPRYKGRQDPKALEQSHPYIVEMAVPEGGFGLRLDEMHLFHLQADITARSGRGRYHEGRHYVRWCFADPRHASAFRGLFGGELLPKDGL